MNGHFAYFRAESAARSSLVFPIDRTFARSERQHVISSEWCKREVVGWVGMEPGNFLNFGSGAD